MTGLEKAVLGSLAQIAKNYWRAIPQAISKYKFRAFFGADAFDRGLVHLVIDPYESIIPRSGTTRTRFIKRFFGHGPDLQIIGANEVIGVCSLRVTEYALAESTKYLSNNNPLKIVLDSDAKDKWDGTFIASGSADSNIKTLDIEKMTEMNLYKMIPGQLGINQMPSWKMNGQDYAIGQTDKAVLMRMRNPRSPGNYLFVIAGFSESGSTGAAWFLFRHWRALHKRFKSGANFCLILDVEANSDESAHEIAAFSP
ncbi:MAG TPA: hypothetical protein VGO35_00285 [Gammaproteobacteria bacterium]|jgi:hypothetical protein|nr:hypothetical protein [Gammaproteobacteria bacterium]